MTEKIIWPEFMNGYRDPKTWAEERERGDFTGGHNSTGSGERECGSRKEGGTYATCPLSPYGMPLEHFIPCKPVPIVADDYNLANVGVKLVDIEESCLKCGGAKPTKKIKEKYYRVCDVCHGSGVETVTHVFDIVGAEYYPNVADFLEEARRMGVSRRLELEDRRQYARLSHRSRLMLLHHKAVINNPLERVKEMFPREMQRLHRAGCPKGLHTLCGETPAGAWLPTGAGNLPPGCSSLYWHMIEKGKPVGEDIPLKRGGQIPANYKEPEMPSNGFVERELASGTYRGYEMPEGFDPQYSLGIFGVFPLVKIQVVDPDGSYENKVDRAKAAGVDVEAVRC